MSVHLLYCRLQRLEEKLEKDQDIFRREERLLLSSMYEVGYLNDT